MPFSWTAPPKIFLKFAEPAASVQAVILLFSGGGKICCDNLPHRMSVALAPLPCDDAEWRDDLWIFRKVVRMD
jgi:hypothetical protein